ncbi:RHS repeat protein [bacterium]|nr:RHS repeat protein [bacterium]MBP9810414.1 RHS repeat protein [bacterium]
MNDSLGRLSEVQMTNGTTIVYAYDAAGNRTSTVTTAGPNGL